MADPTTYLDEIVNRILAQCMEAVPGNAGFNYHGTDYANTPFWTVGETDVQTSLFGSELEVTPQITARLYGGKTSENNEGVVETDLRGYIPLLITYFADHLDLTSEEYPEPMDFIVQNQIILNPIRRRIVGQNPSYFVLELIFNVPVLL